MAKKCKKKSGTHKKRQSKKHDLYPGQAHILQPIPPGSGSKSPEPEQEHPEPEPTEEQNKDAKSAKDQNETAKLRFRAIIFIIILLVYIGALFLKPEAAPDLKSILDKLFPAAIAYMTN